jgi:hypothetical protein
MQEGDLGGIAMTGHLHLPAGTGNSIPEPSRNR